MRQYHRHTLLYLHETIALGSGSSEQFTQAFTDTYQPMMQELGARLFALWESTPHNGHRPPGWYPPFTPATAKSDMPWRN